MSEKSDRLAVLVDAMMAEGEGNIALRLVAADGKQLPPFEAGAHVDLHLPGGLARPYSIASSPTCTDHYLLCVKREQGTRGASSAIHTMVRVGDLLSISLPRNLFRLMPAKHHILMAGGIGITPLLSMAEALEATDEMASFELHYYVSRRQQIAFRRRLGSGFERGEVNVHVSEEGCSPRHMPPPPPLSDTHLYLCGPQAFMDALQDGALRAGWDPAHIHREAFGLGPSSPDHHLDDEAFEVELAQDGRVFLIPADRSIASILVEAGIDVPLSCEMGICGACLTPVLSGDIDHRDEITHGQGKDIALCCSRSRSKRLLIDL